MPVLPIIGIAAAAAGTAISTVGQVKAGNAAKATGEYNAQTDIQNSQYALQDAQTSEAQRREADRLVLSGNKAAFGASGIDVNSGSPLEVLAYQTAQAEKDALNIRRSGALESQAYIRQSEADRLAGQNAQAASRYNAAGTLLTGTASTLKNVRAG